MNDLNSEFYNKTVEETITHTDIIKAIFDDEEDVHIRVFDDKGGTYADKMSYKAGLFEQHIDELKELNAKNNGIFFVVNSGGDDDDHITKFNAQFVESDKLSFDEMLKRIESFPLRPSIIIKTKKSLHTYWLIKNGVRDKFRPIQLGLVDYFDGDIKCQNESRVMRLPGFNHCKNKPIEVKCIFFEPQNRYSQDDFLAAMPDIDLTPVEVKDGTNEGVDIVTMSCDFMKHCKEDSQTLSEHDWYAMITNLCPFKGGVKLIHEYSKDYNGYSKRKTDKKIEHFIKSKTKPMTCQTIVEKGYQCPKYLSGECDCRSPAALAYKPLSLDVLNALLDKLPITNNPLTDMPIINKFVTKYLYNQERTTGDVFISYSIKDKFKLKTEEIKSIKSMFNKLNKEYEKSQSGNEDNETLKPWYAVTKSGYKFMPMILANHLKDNEQVIYVAQEHYKYMSGVYKKIETIEAEAIVQNNLMETEGKLTQIKDCEQQWRMKTFTHINELNPNPYIINVRNGLYDVINDTLKPHDDKYLSTIQFNVNYNPDAKCPLFIKYLNDVLEGDTEQINLIQEILGYLLVPITSAQRTFVIHGEGNTGKSVLLHVINVILLGKENVSNVTWQDLGDKFRTAQLFGKLANIFADLPTKNIDDTGVFKALVGEDLVLCEEKFKKPFSFKSNARLVFSCNKIPVSYNDKTKGFYRRLLIIPFDHVVTNVDVDLKKKLESEADGIFNFALLGLRKLMAQNYKFSETKKNKDALEVYRIESDSVLSFVNECCEIDLTSKKKSIELYHNYECYCKRSGAHPVMQKNFTLTLMSNFKELSKVKANTNNMIIGLKVLDDTLNNFGTF